MKKFKKKRSTEAAPCESSLYLDDKEPSERANLTQWNGRMVMETAFNLHRRSLFVELPGKKRERKKDEEGKTREARARELLDMPKDERIARSVVVEM